MTTNLKVGILGGGLAGLTTAYRLQQAGISSTVYEGSNRFGGRCFTGRLCDGQLFERGGEFIDSYHVDILELIAELGLNVIDLLAAEKPGTMPFYNVIDFSQSPPVPVKYTYEEANADYQVVAAKIFEDTENSYPLNADSSVAVWPLIYPEGALALDSISLEQYINKLCLPLGGAKSKFAQLLKVAYTIEFGAEPKIQSPLNLLFLLGFNPDPVFRIFGISDEKYRIEGGNSLLVDKLLENTHQNMYLYSIVKKIKRLCSGSYEVTFIDTVKEEKFKEVFDELVITLPFRVLKCDVDISEAGFSDLKYYAIDNLNMSDNSKTTYQFGNRFWIEEGSNGETFATNQELCGKECKYQNTWDTSRGQPQPEGILTQYTGGNRSSRILTVDPVFSKYIEFRYPKNKQKEFAQREEKKFLTQLSQLIPNAKCQQSISFASDRWKDSPWQHGAYAFWKKGQYIAHPNHFAGYEAVPEPYYLPENQRNCHFAGEHTAYDYQGYLNGAVVSANRVTNEILANVAASQRITTFSLNIKAICQHMRKK